VLNIDAHLGESETSDQYPRSIAAQSNLQERFDGFRSGYRMSCDPKCLLTTASDATYVGRYGTARASTA
jgi:hypothetical protein